MNEEALSNEPPAIDLLRDGLAERHGDLMTRAGELIVAADRAPATVQDDETAGKTGDFIKQLTACIKNAEAARVVEKEPHMAAGRAVDAWFKNGIIDPLTNIKKLIEARLGTYARRKADEERLRREEEFRKAQEEVERLRREAEEKAKTLEKPSQVEAAVGAAQAFDRAAEEARKAQLAAEATPADLARTRGDYGSVSSLRRAWTFDGLDRSDLDLETLRPFLPLDGLEKAVRAYIKGGGRQLKGVRIFETTEVVVR